MHKILAKMNLQRILKNLNCAFAISNHYFSSRTPRKYLRIPLRPFRFSITNFCSSMRLAAGITIIFARLALQPIKRSVVDEDDPDDGMENVKLPKRLKRFKKFASIEYDGEIFMSPQDFLDSLTLDEPRERVFRTVINDQQVKRMLKNTPPLRLGSHRMFRELGEFGIISYAEYLFLVTLLTKSQYSFNVAFIMFDEDENMQIDKEEFLKIQYLIVTGTRQPKVEDEQLEAGGQNYYLDSDQCRLDADFQFQGDFLPRFQQSIGKKEFERLINSNVLFHAKTPERLRRERRERQQVATAPTAEKAMEQAVNEMKQHDTTITMHLFGRKGRDSLSFDQFQMFYQNLQKELIEIEFREFSRGKDRISAVDFARLVLRYSILHKSEQSPYIRRVYERSEYDDEGISLQQFETFSMFLNNLEDFSKAVRLYAVADIPVSQSEFIRAVLCSTGKTLDPALVNVLFKIFDANGDDRLSYSEFIAVMSDRQSRGFKKSHQHNAGGWPQFRECVRNELNSSSFA